MMKNNHNSSGKIERVKAPTREHFFENYVDRNTPVILTGVATKWPAYSDWTPDCLKSIAGDSIVTAHYNDNANFHEWYMKPEEREDRKIKFGELLDALVGDPPDSRLYMTEHELGVVSPKLLEDVDFSDYLTDIAPFEPLLFLGRDTCMPMHYHGHTEAFLCQLQGSKRINLYSPDQHSLLYARPWYQPSPLFSEINGRQIHEGNPNYDRFPKFRRARPLEFVLEPGEMLFIPVHWWHLTSVSGFQVSVTHFWKARMKSWRFPTPGLQVLAREVLINSRKRLNAAKKNLKALFPLPTKKCGPL